MPAARLCCVTSSSPPCGLWLLFFFLVAEVLSRIRPVRGFEAALPRVPLGRKGWQHARSLSPPRTLRGSPRDFRVTFLPPFRRAFDVVRPALPTLAGLIQMEDSEVVTDARPALFAPCSVPALHSFKTSQANPGPRYRCSRST